MDDDSMTRPARIREAARRAAQEAEARRRSGATHRIDPDARPREDGGPRGLEPVRYGDWERNGRATDF